MFGFLILVCFGLTSFSSVLSASSGSCKDVNIPDVSNLKKCLTQTTCSASQDPIDAVKPVVTCVYEALKEQSTATDVVVAYGDVIYALVSATKNKDSSALAKDFKNSVDQTKPGTVKLTRCTHGTFSVSLPSNVVGKCSSDFGTDCQKSSTALVSPLVKYVLCLVNNALPNASQDKVVELVCDLVKRTDVSSMGGSYLATAVKDINQVLCS
ncbi:uncharacterized protein [Dermacentor albipictus]|uniref:uncharacterized protein isoform X2 n=1 Tax=Dermacentor albipictus TaxID=60249 RepID=UPI0038FC9AB1